MLACDGTECAIEAGGQARELRWQIAKAGEQAWISLLSDLALVPSAVRYGSTLFLSVQTDVRGRQAIDDWLSMARLLASSTGRLTLQRI